MSALTIIAAVLSGALWIGLLYVLVFESIRDWLRHRHDVKVEPSPLIREIDRWRASRERAFRRAGIQELEGHHRVGQGLDPRRRRA